MGPPPPKRPRKQEVLDEDTYVEAIEKIIERDFFPDNSKLQNRLDWLEAVRSGDPDKIRSVQMSIVRQKAERAAAGVTPSLSGKPMCAWPPARQFEKQRVAVSALKVLDRMANT